tara:strand:- start:1591 stop:1992 length:402 start_codon:yes stop_codon:yes gene_type:complete
VSLKFFTYKEFDCPYLPGSGKVMMKPHFLKFIDTLRGRCKFPFYISSGFRTKEFNQYLIDNPKYKASKTSSHLKGLACDIKIRDSKKRAIFIGCAIELASEMDYPVRIGVSKTFCHIDLDTAYNKKSPRIWLY